MKRVPRDVAVRRFKPTSRGFRADRWRARYGAGVSTIPVVAFGAEVTAALDPVLDPAEHDSFAWYAHEQADAVLDWPIEQDALPGRRKALAVLAAMIGDEPNHNA